MSCCLYCSYRPLFSPFHPPFRPFPLIGVWIQTHWKILFYSCRLCIWFVMSSVPDHSISRNSSPRVPHFITLINGSKVASHGVGQVSFASSITRNIFLLVLTCPLNLISLTQLTMWLNCSLIFHSNSSVICRSKVHVNWLAREKKLKDSIVFKPNLLCPVLHPLLQNFAPPLKASTLIRHTSTRVIVWNMSTKQTSSILLCMETCCKM